jgi:hypothetical protein
MRAHSTEFHPTNTKGCTHKSSRFRTFPRIVREALMCRIVPFWAYFTPRTCLIFINNTREELGVL